MSAALILAGFCVGALVGLSGVGGGSLMTPLLVFLGLDPLIAVGTDLLYSLPTKMFGWYLHRKQGTMNSTVVRSLCLGGIPGSIAGLGVLYLLGGLAGSAFLKTFAHRSIGIAVCMSAVMILASPLIFRYRHEHEDEAANGNIVAAQAKRRLIAVGAAVGFMVSLTSIGGGSLALPLMALLLPKSDIAELVGSDIAFGAILVLFASMGHWTMNHVDWTVTANLITGSLLGVFLGSKLCKVMQQRWLRPALAAVLIVAGARILI